MVLIHWVRNVHSLQFQQLDSIYWRFVLIWWIALCCRFLLLLSLWWSHLLSTLKPPISTNRNIAGAGLSGVDVKRKSHLYTFLLAALLSILCLAASAPFCLSPDAGFARFSTEVVTKSASTNKFIEFDFSMVQPGTHTLQVFVRCVGQEPRIDLLQGGGVYSLSSSGSGYGGHKCLELHKHIDAAVLENSITCTEFEVVFRGHAAAGGTELCVNNYSFQPDSALGFTPCRKFHSLSVVTYKLFTKFPLSFVFSWNSQLDLEEASSRTDRSFSAGGQNWLIICWACCFKFDV